MTKRNLTCNSPVQNRLVRIFPFSESVVSHSGSGSDPDPSQVNPFRRVGGTIMIPAPPAPGASHLQASGGSSGMQASQGFTQMYGAKPQVPAFYGGRMTEDRLLAVKNATSEAIDHLHKSLESCPDAEAEAPDPKGIKVGQSFSCTAGGTLSLSVCYFSHFMIGCW